MTGSRIIGAGVYRPSQKISADELAERGQNVKGAPVNRYQATDKETSVFMGTTAALHALENAGIRAEDVDFLLYFSGIPDYDVPKDGNLILKNIQARNAAAMNIDTACASFISQLRMADLLISSGQAETILLVEVMSWLGRAIDIKGPYATLGDGASAVVVSKANERHLVAVEEKTFPGHFDFITLTSSHVSGKKEYLQFSYDPSHTRFFLKEAPELLVSVCNSPGTMKIDWLIAHQTGVSMLQKWGRSLGLPVEKVLHTYDEAANMSAVTIPFTLHDYLYEDKKIKPGDNLAFFAVGAGLHGAAMAWRF